MIKYLNNNWENDSILCIENENDGFYPGQVLIFSKSIKPFYFRQFYATFEEWFYILPSEIQVIIIFNFAEIEEFIRNKDA